MFLYNCVAAHFNLANLYYYIKMCSYIHMHNVSTTFYVHSYVHVTANYLRICSGFRLEPIVCKILPTVSSVFLPNILTNNHLLFLYNFTGSVTLMSKMLAKLLEATDVQRKESFLAIIIS